MLSRLSLSTAGRDSEVLYSPIVMNLHCRPATFLFLVFFSVPWGAARPSAAAGVELVPAPNLDHSPVYSATAGKSVPISVTFAAPEEIAEIRLYFKTMGAGDYFFLPMALSGKGTYTAALPPARNWTKGIDYLLLRKSTRGEVRKTKPFRLLIQNDYTSAPPSPGEIQVQAEHSTARAENFDFLVPLRVGMTTEPLLTEATEDPYPPITVPGPGAGNSAGGMFGGPGGISFSIKVGGIRFAYRSFSGH